MSIIMKQRVVFSLLFSFGLFVLLGCTNEVMGVSTTNDGIECDYSVSGHINDDQNEDFVCLNVDESVVEILIHYSVQDRYESIGFKDVFGSVSGLLESGLKLDDLVDIKEGMLHFHHLAMRSVPVQYHFNVIGTLKKNCVVFESNDIASECQAK